MNKTKQQIAEETIQQMYDANHELTQKNQALRKDCEGQVRVITELKDQLLQLKEQQSRSFDAYENKLAIARQLLHAHIEELI